MFIALNLIAMLFSVLIVYAGLGPALVSAPDTISVFIGIFLYLFTPVTLFYWAMYLKRRFKRRLEKRNEHKLP